jgi:hypothetical protein
MARRDHDRDDDGRPRRRYDEEDDYRDGPPRKGTDPAVWIVLGVGVVFGGVLLLGCLGYLFTARTAVAPAPPAATVAGPVKKTYTREEFKKAVMGKTMEEVRALLGAPDKTRDAAGGVVRWHYNQRTVDPVTGKPDIFAEVNFDKSGVAESVNF